MNSDKNSSISVVIPVFAPDLESRTFLFRAIHSINTQDSLPDEIILSLDFPKSNDPFFEEVRQLFPNLQIRFIDNPGEPGISSNSNSGISTSSATLIHVLHQDDWLINPYLYSQIKKEYRNSPNSFWLLASRRLDKNLSPNFDITALVGNNRFGGPSGVIFPKSTSNLFNVNLAMLCDVELVFRLISEYGKPRVIAQPSIE